jgi:hypothetical protein
MINICEEMLHIKFFYMRKHSLVCHHLREINRKRKKINQISLVLSLSLNMLS